MNHISLLFICLFAFLQLTQLSCQEDYRVKQCKLENLATTKVYKNNICIVAYNFLVEMETDNLEGALNWSNPEWLYNNLLESFVGGNVLDSLALSEKKELVITLSGFTKSYLEDKRNYNDEKNTNNQNTFSSNKQITAYIKSNLACVVFGEHMVYLQLDEKKNWKAFKVEKSNRDTKIRFIQNKL
ncbi:MAG: hypothetical protein MI974_25015 [Chitinophagales bacterium]|nr:hypothetical protein [Chitinophagales bacterium]